MSDAGSLAGFILARIAEDEDAAFGTSEAGYVTGPVGSRIGTTVGGKRLRDECEAKRRIVEEYVESQACALDEAHDPDSLTECAWRGQGLHEAVTILASVFADHPDYEEAWKPWKL